MANADSIMIEFDEIYQDIDRRIFGLYLVVFAAKAGEQKFWEKRDPTAVSGRGRKARKGDLHRASLQMCCIYEVVLLEELIRSYVQVFYKYKPMELNTLAGEKDDKITDEAVASQSEIVKKAMRRELYRFSGNIDKVESQYFKKLFEHSLSSCFEGWQKLRRIYFLRNLVVHERSIMSQKFHSEFGGRVPPGAKFQIQPKEDVGDICDVLYLLNDHVREIVEAKLGLT